MQNLKYELNTHYELFNAVAKDIIASYHKGRTQSQLVATLVDAAKFSSLNAAPNIARADPAPTTELATIDFKMLVRQRSDAPIWVIERYLQRGVANEEPPEPEPEPGAAPAKRMRPYGDFKPE